MKKLLLVLLLLWASTPDTAQAVCTNNGMMNPVSDVCWECIFPIKIGDTAIYGGPAENDTTESESSTTCVCPAPYPKTVRFGVTLSLFEPARFVEVVKDPYCFPGIGSSTQNTDGRTYFLGGGSTRSVGNNLALDSSSFYQAHYWIFPLWSMLEMMIDYACSEHSGFDIGYITEVDPLWQSDALAMLINPEALLFSNPIAQMACAIDSISSNLGMSFSPLFWCMGSQGSAYPLTGHVNDENYIQASFSIAGRMVYKLSREMLICDPAVWYCACVPMPIWIKHHYRFHLAKPVRDFWCHPIGRSGMLWAWAKNPPVGGDNYIWMVFRRRICCMGQ